MSKIVIGLGNPILSDDAVGLRVLEALRSKNEGRATFMEANSGGLALLDMVQGFDEAVLIDSIMTGQVPPGTLMVFSLQDFSETRHASNLHDVNFATALEIGKNHGLKIPDRFTIYAVEVTEVLTFSATMTPEIEASLQKIISEIAARENLLA